MAYFKIGSVTHYYDKIAVAIIELSSDLAIGDTVLFKLFGEALFEQKITTLQVDTVKVERAKNGEVVGVKTTHALSVGAEVYRLG